MFQNAFGWCNDRTEDEMQNVDMASQESIQRFNTDFDTNFAIVAQG